MSLLATCAFARPQRARTFDESVSIEQKHRLTAITITDDGPSVECWEVDALLPGRDEAHKKQPVSGLYVGINSYEGVQSLLDMAQSNEDDVPFFGYASSYTLTTGIIEIGYAPISVDGAESSNDRTEIIFSAENGDSWFYLEDISSAASARERCAKNVDSPVTIETRSATETTLIRFEHPKTPEHTVLHKGKCNFAGLRPASEVGTLNDPDRPDVGLRVQK